MKAIRTLMAAALLLIGSLLPAALRAQNVMPQLGDKISTSDGIYVVSGPNLIPNASFDDGFTNWHAGNNADLSEENFELIADGGADGGPYLKAKGSAGSGNAKSIKQGWAVEEGKTYLFSMWALRSASGMSSNTQYSRIYASDSETGTNTQISSVSFQADTWTQTQLVFTAEKPFIVANLGWMNSMGVDAFFLGEVSLSDELATASLEAAIADGKYQLENTVEGTERGQYTADVRATLQAAITAAEGVLASATTQEQVNEAVSTLKTAISTYKASANAPFQVGKKYNIVHNSGFYMTATGGTVKIVAADVEDPGQVFSFVPASADAAAVGFNLQADDGTFIHRQGSWDTKADADFDLNDANAIFQVVDQGTYIQFKNMGSGSVLGTDNNTDGSSVYSNKNGTDGKFRWTLKEFVPKDQRDDEYNFRELLAKAQKQRDEVSEASLGTDLFMNSRQAYDTFVAAVAQAEAVTAGYKAAADVLQAAMDTYAANKQIKPAPEKIYIITQQAGGNRMTYNAEQTLVTVAAPAGEATQQFTFTQPAGTSYFGLKNVQSGLYVAKSGSSNWDTNWAETDADALAQWTIARLADGTYTLQNASGKGYLGSDEVADGSLLYCDKAATAVNSKWLIEEFSATAALLRAIAQAKDLAATTPVGAAYYEVPQSAMDALQAAISAAESALATVGTFDEGAAEAAKLNTAIDAFNAAFNPMSEFDEGQTYVITHYGGSVLTATASGNATITALTDEGATEQQLVTLEPVTGQPMTYYFRSVALGTYLALSGTYDTKWQEADDNNAAIQVVQLSGRWLGLRFLSNGLHAGTDGSASGQMVYSDKTGAGNTLAYWTIEPFVTVQLERDAFNAALAQANEQLAAMQPGYLTGQYFQDDISAFRTLIAATRSAANKAKEQAELDAITAQLLKDIEAARAKVHDHDYMNHTALAAAISAAERSLAGAQAGDLNGQYPASAIQAYQLVLTQAQTVNQTADDQLTQAAIDGATAALQEAAKTFAAAVVKISYTDLSAAVSAAQQAIKANEAVKGEGAGKIPAAAFEALQAEITKAQDMQKGHTHNQAGVDAQAAALTAATQTFLAARVSNDYSLLQQYVTLAEQLLKQAQDGQIEYLQEDYDDLLASYQKNSPYLQSTDQDAIDRAGKLMRRDVLLFQQLITGIKGLSAAESVSDVYDLSGRKVERNSGAHGIRIVRRADGTTRKVRF